jgi:hypothetical protein
MMSVTPHTSVDEFFREVVVEALESQHVEATQYTEFYLVGLLGEFTTARLPDEPLSIKLAQAGSRGPEQRLKALKEVGDTSLYVTGFFAESFDRKLIDADYYIGLGEAAYRELSCSLTGASHIQEVYAELAAKFPRFVDVLQEIRTKVSFAGSDVVKLYEEWLHTRSEWIERRMRALGLIVPDPSGNGGRGSIH